jgi:exopolyphosphatase
MSLVLDQCQSTWASLSSSPACEDGTSTAECDAHLARVALAPILLDTTNLTSKDKTTDQDVRAAELAESKLQPSPQTTTTTTNNPSPDPPYNRTTYHTTLTTLKEQILNLSYRDILRKDYKRWSEGALALGMSTVVQGLAYTFAEVGAQSRDAFLAALGGWAAEQRLDVAAVMTVSKPDGVFTRELLVWGVSEEGGKVVREFGRRFGERLGLEAWGGGELDEGAGAEGEG